MKTLAWLCCVAALALVAGCGKPTKKLYVYNWSDYMAPEVVAKFEKQFDCKVVVDYFDSNEAMYAKLKAGVSGYDLIFPSSYIAAVMRAQGMLLELDHAKLPNLKQVMREYTAKTEDKAMAYSVPYAVTFTGLGYNLKDIKDFKPSWGVFGDAKLKGRMTMLNDMREAIGAALKFQGHSYNSVDDQELEQAKTLLLAWKANLAAFAVDEAKVGLAASDFLVSQSYNGDILQLAADKPFIAFATPAEGTAMSVDVMVVPAQAKNPGLAHDFINFIYSPDVCAENMRYICYLTPCQAALDKLDKSLRDNPAFMLSPALMAKSEVIRDLGKDNAKYVKLWDTIKTK